MGMQVFSHLQESRAPSPVTVSWEDKLITQNVPPFLLLPPTLHTEHGLDYPFGQLGSRVLAVFPPDLPDSPNFLTSVAIQRALALCKPCLAIANTSLYYQLCVRHKSRAQPQ